MRDSIRSAMSVLVALAGAAVALPTQAQAYSVRVLEAGPGQHAWITAITDAGDAVGRVGDAYAVWQSGPGFGRDNGLTVLHQVDPPRIRQKLTGHADEAGYWYGSRDGRASV